MPVIVAFTAQASDAQTVAPPADAASAAAPQSLGNVVVTATKRGATTVQNVPISIQAITGDELARRGATDFNDFYRQVPGLAVQDSGPGDKRYVIRGVNASGPGTVGVYLDEAIVTGENAQDGGGQQTDIKLFDLDRVEVLKGPQGTTFGSSSLAGTIRYITKKPKFNLNSASASYSLVSTKGAAPGRQADAAVNLSLVPDRLAIRIAGFDADLPGYIDSRFGTGVDGERSTAARLSARFAITDDLVLSASTQHQRTRQDSKNYYNEFDSLGAPLPADFQADVARAPFRDRSHIDNATLEYTHPVGTFTLTGSHFARDLAFRRDASIVAQDFGLGPYLGTGRSVIDQPKERQVNSVEARYASSFGGPVEVLVGAFSQSERRDFRSTWATVNADGALDLATASLYLDRSVSTRIQERAFFGEVTYEVVRDLKLTAGARHYDFESDETTDAITGFGGSPGAGVGLPSHSEYSGWIPRFNLAWATTANLNTYVQAAKGFRAGGNNDQTAAAIANVTIPAGYAPDTVWNYEVGAKTWTTDRKLYLNAAAYYVDWSNIQIQLQTKAVGGTASFPYTGNGGGAHVRGFELEAGGSPVAGLNVSGNVNFNDAVLSKTNAPPASGDKGDRLPYVPRWTAAALADYDFPLPAFGLTGTVGGDLSFTGRRATELNEGVSSYHALPASTLFSLRTGVKTKGWSVLLLASNLFDNRKPTNVTATIAGVSPDQYYTARPRTIGLRVSAAF